MARNLARRIEALESSRPVGDWDAFFRQLSDAALFRLERLLEIISDENGQASNEAYAGLSDDDRDFLHRVADRREVE